MKDNPKIRQSFDRLSQKTFGLSFESWYHNGYWGEKYIPHVLLYHGDVVANVSVNIINMVRECGKKRYLQLGTVMTEETYRNQGLCRYLIQHVLEKREEKYDAVFLFANDSVLDFYPKFGYQAVPQYQHTMTISPSAPTFRKLDMTSQKDIHLLCDRFRLGNPFSALSMEENQGLLLFYCTQFLKDSVYYSPKYETAVIADFDGETMLCYDLFGPDGPDLGDILASAAPACVNKAALGFTPKEKRGDVVFFQEEDTTLFLLPNPESAWFQQEKMMFPLLSHA